MVGTRSTRGIVAAERLLRRGHYGVIDEGTRSTRGIVAAERLLRQGTAGLSMRARVPRVVKLPRSAFGALEALYFR